MTKLRIAVAVLGFAAFAAGPVLAGGDGGGCSSYGGQSHKTAETVTPTPSTGS